MAQATFRHGNPVMVDYTPASGDLTAGDVVVLVSITANTTGAGLTTGITHKDIANNKQGAIAGGGGVYDVVMAGNYANWTKVFWDDTADKVTTTSTNNGQFGYIVSGGGAGANATVSVLHHPNA